MIPKILRNIFMHKVCSAILTVFLLSSCAPLKPIFSESNNSLKTFTRIPKPPEIRIKDLANKDAEILKKQHVKVENTQTESLSSNFNSTTQNNQTSIQEGKLLWPVKGKVVISFAEQVQQKKTLPGIHILAYKNCPVKASTTGVVSHSGSYGIMNFVIISSYPDIKIAYGYLSSEMPKIGERISAGQTIGHVLGKGDKPVLYFAVKKNNIMVDPLKYLQ